MDNLLWTNSGDSHFIEPPNLFKDNLPRRWPTGCRARRRSATPRRSSTSTAGSSAGSCRSRQASTAEALTEFREAQCPSAGRRGAAKRRARLEHLDDQGVWGEVVFPSLGLWYSEIHSTPHLVVGRGQGAQRLRARRAHPHLAALRADRHAAARSRSRPRSPRWPSASPASASSAVFLPTASPTACPYWNDDQWEPLWAACDEAGLVVGLPHRHRRRARRAGRTANPGGALFNYVDTTFGGQKAAAAMIGRRRARTASRPEGPDLRGRRHLGAVRRRPAERVLPPAPDVRRRPPAQARRRSTSCEQVYASFQHDETAVPAMTGDGLPQHDVRHRLPAHRGHVPAHPEGAARDPRRCRRRDSDRIRLGAFLELFPSVGEPAALASK